jgi:CHAD domain-containing protein
MRHPVIKMKKSLNENVTNLLLHYNSQAILQLDRKNNLNDSIHKVRLCCKRNRSILRLAKPGMDSHHFANLNATYRDLSSRFSQIRDMTALIDTLSIVSSSVHTSSNLKFIADYRRTLQNQRAKALKSDDFQQVLTEVKSGFQNSEVLVSDITFKGDLPGVFGKGIRQTYKKGVKLWRVNEKNADDHTMHQWRKAVKYFWYQLVVLDPVWPGMITALAKEMQTLSKLLGLHHDLVVLYDALAQEKGKSDHKTEIGSIQRIISQKKKNLEKQALILGGKLFFLPSKQLDHFVENLFNNR